MPRNSLVNGKVAPDSFGTQLDETAYPILMAAQLGMTDASLYANHIKPAANFLAGRGPAFGVERWEEQSGFSPSTIAAEVAGLVAAAQLARVNGDTDRGGRLARHRGRVAAARQELDGDDERAAAGAAVLHPALEDRRSERGHLLQRRQRRPHARPACRDRRRLPRARPARPTAALGSRRRAVAADRRCDDQEHDVEGPGLAPLQRRRLRRPRERRSAVGPERPGHGSSLAGALGRARRADPCDRQLERRGIAARGHERLRLGRRAHPGTELGAAGPAGLTLRHRPHHRVDRLRERWPGRLGGAADVVGRVVRAARGQHRGATERRPARDHLVALRRAHAGNDPADGDGPGRQLGRLGVAGDGHRHDRAREQRLRGGDQYRCQLGDDVRLDRPPRRTAPSASPSRSRAARTSSTWSRSARPAAPPT